MTNFGSKYTATTYGERVEQAIAAGDVDALIEFAYGYPCRCTKLKGEPLCVCQMQAKALREKVVPLALFKHSIERVTAA
ncbi:MAG: hypothetical protein JWQ94_3336 [Tardiphaga sp.]|jgi:hypothetical protein|nr:hypothetical protein [Tardiphaga sp.]